MKSGLLRPRFDKRDYLHHSYGSTVSTFPLEFDVDAGLWCPDQNTSNAATGIETVPPLPEGCTDYSQVDLYNNHVRTLHSPMLLENITHANARGGIDIREALNAARKLGWFDHYAQIQAKSPFDMFDAISNALLSEQADRWAVSAGTQFYREWLGVNGPLPTPFFDPSAPWHNWDITGRTTVAGVPYLRCKMWDGTWKLMSRELCNALFAIRGAVAFIPSNTQATGQTIDWTYVQFVVGLFQNLVTAIQAKLTPTQVSPIPAPAAPINVVQLQPAPPAVSVPQAPVYDWSTPEASRHSVRVICDEEVAPVHNFFVDGKAYLLKDVLCACIQIESQFYNYLPNGQPVKHINPTSTDWGICQINDHYHIGPKLDFPSVEFVMQNPDKAVRFMARMFNSGNAHLWVSYLSGAFKKNLPSA